MRCIEVNFISTFSPQMSSPAIAALMVIRSSSERELIVLMTSSLITIVLFSEFMAVNFKLYFHVANIV